MVLSGCLISISEVDTMVISDTDKKLLASFLMVSSAAHENFPHDYYNETWKSEKLPGYSLIVKFNNRTPCMIFDPHFDSKYYL